MIDFDLHSAFCHMTGLQENYVDKISYIKNQIELNCRIKIDDRQSEQLLIYYEMIVEKNKVMNLTAITDFEEFVTKHFVDSISICKVIELNNKNFDVIDIGTGAGFPGIPLKIVYPGLSITLFDSLQKRLTFLDEVIDKLALQNIRTLHGRAEEFGRKLDYREKYDIVVSRAVAELTTLCELALPFCKTGGRFISYKGSKGKEELEAASYCIKALGGTVDKEVEFLLNENDNKEADENYSRLLIDIKKVHKTDSKYPRGGGKPFKQPLQKK